MFEEYRRDWSGIALAEAADQRIRRALAEKASGEPARKPLRAWKTILIAAAVCIFLVGSVMAVSGFNFSEIPETLRL